MTTISVSPRPVDITGAEYGYIQFIKIWEMLCGDVCAAFQFSDRKKELLGKKNIARLIGALPFLAGCQNQKQTAIAHLSVYILSLSPTTKEIYYHQIWEDDKHVLNRLRPINNFVGGNPLVIKKGMSLLALNMLSDYQRDIDKDFEKQKYNPIGAGRWEFVKMKNQLLETINSIDCPEIDDIMDPGIACQGFWGL